MSKLEELFAMIEKLLHGEYDPTSFSFDFPDELCEVYRLLETKDAEILRLLNDDLVDACAWFDPYDTGDEGTIDEKEFRRQVEETYNKAIELYKNEKTVKAI